MMSETKCQGVKSTDTKAAKVNSWVDQVKDFNESEGNTSLFEEFTQNATVHGIKYTARGYRGAYSRGFWCLAFLGMLTALFYTVICQLIAMMDLPTKTEQDVEFANSLPFPAVTLCNLNQFRKSQIGGSQEARELLFAMSDLNLRTGQAYTNGSNLNLEFTHAQGMNDYLLNISHSLNHTLIHCSWDGQPFHCSELFTTQLTDFGMCYTFNGRDGTNSPPKRAFRAGSRYGLSVVANIQQDEYVLGANNDAAGLRVLLHDHHETPLVEGKGFEVGPGTSTKASISIKQVNYLPPPFTSHYGVKCTNTSDEKFQNFLTLFDSYDVGACIAECRYNYTFNKCKCRGLFDRGNDTYCSARESLNCYYPTFKKFMHDNLSWGCQCPMPCERNFFEAEVSQSSYPSSALMEEVNALYDLNMTESKFRQNYLKLTLSYDKFLLETIRQVPQYTFESVMSTLGGQLGIFLGASILSLLEVVEFGLVLLFGRLSKGRNRKNR